MLQCFEHLNSSLFQTSKVERWLFASLRFNTAGMRARLGTNAKTHCGYQEKILFNSKWYGVVLCERRGSVASIYVKSDIFHNVMHIFYIVLDEEAVF